MGLKKDVGDTNTIRQIRSHYETCKNYVRMQNNSLETFSRETGLRQGCTLSRHLFDCVFLGDVIKSCKKKFKTHKVGFTKIIVIKLTELCHADDMVIIDETEKDL